MKRWCKWQEEDAEGIYCAAHIHESRVFQCPYKDNAERISAEYQCQDYSAADGGKNNDSKCNF